MYPKKTLRLAAAAAAVLCSLSLSCTSDREVKTLKIAEQYGLAYAPLSIVKELGFLEEEAAVLSRKGDLHVEVQWLQLGNTAAIREAAAAGRVDAACMGIPPFLISRDRGMEWEIVSGLCRAPLGLITWREDLQDLSDIGEDISIVLPQPGSIQHILLTMAADRMFSDPDRFDRQLLSMKHPDGMQALLARREIAAHFTSPPYLFLEQDAGMRTLISGEECFGGPFTFIVAVATAELIADAPELVELFLQGIDRGIAYIREQPEEAAKLLSSRYSMESGKVLSMLTDSRMHYEREIRGIEQFRSFMRRNGYLEN